MGRQQDSLVKKISQFQLIIVLTLGFGCTALPPMYRDLSSAFTLPMPKDTDSSVSHFKDQESNKIIVNSMGWDDLGKTAETQCENAYQKAEDKIYTIARKTVSQSSLKRRAL